MALTPSSSTGGSGGGAATIADGADVAEGAIADAVVAAGATGTVSAKLRRLTTDLGALILQVPAALGAGGGMKIEGTVASDAPVTANPLLDGGRASTAVPSAVSADGDLVALWLSRNGLGNTAIRSFDGANAVTVSNFGADNLTTGSSILFAGVAPSLFDGASTFNRQRGNVEATLLASASRSATTNTPDQTNYNGRGCALVLNVTVEAGGVETLALKIQGKDSISGNYYDIVSFGTVYDSATQAPTVTAVAIMYPGVTDADIVGTTGFSKGMVLPRTWRAVVTHSASGSWTYSLSGVTIL